MPFQDVPSRTDFVALELAILRFWEEDRSFEKLVQKNANGQPWSFIDGPITANNPMGVHHAWGRSYKDFYQRYQAMLGRRLRYQNGFDCQGLWVEVEVEKDMGFNSKRDIVDYGLAEFSRACRARVEKFAATITEQTKRLGSWMDWGNSYFTMSDQNIETIWFFLKRCQEKGWLYEGTRVMPWCIRCGTSLSQHELIDSYRDVEHESVFLKLPIHGRDNEYIAVWTTTPWTLPANTAAAVNPDLTYVAVRDSELRAQSSELVYCSKGTVGRIFGKRAEIVRELKGEELVGLRYNGPFDELPAQHGVDHHVIPWDAVAEDEGTGIVHLAPGCGAEDFDLSQQHNLSVLAPLDESGYYVAGYGDLLGRHAPDVPEFVFDSLRTKGFLIKTELYPHRYPVCWRCGEELVFRLVGEWFISSDEIRPRMKREAAKVRWVPPHAGDLMQDWLTNMRDWCISRKRFWGLPLPFYRCACGHLTIVESLQDLHDRATEKFTYAPTGNLPKAELETQSSELRAHTLPELHRPWIDDIKIACEKCGKPTERISEVGDCWLDAGIVPFSTLGYRTDHNYWQEWYPAAWISEMREQIRLWFYSMLFMSVTLEDKAPYQACLVYEKMNDEHGQPMHKSHGNAIWLDDAAEKMGADAMRWVFASQNLKSNLNFGYGPAGEVRRRLLTLWNVYSFFVTYANIDGFDPSMVSVPTAQRGKLDRWLLSRLQDLIGLARRAFESYDVAPFAQAFERFVDEDLSNWHVRRSRRRFWKAGDDADKASAYLTLYEALVTLAKLIAPIVPFLSESMYQNLVRTADSSAATSVHHCQYPEVDSSLVDRDLERDMALVRHVVELGLAARHASKVKVRQPLPSIEIALGGSNRWPADMEDLVKDELNVKAVHPAGAENLADRTYKANLPLLGPKLGARLREVRAAVEGGQMEALPSGGYRAAGIELAPDEVFVSLKGKQGYEVAGDQDVLVALDTTITPELVLEGRARELSRKVNDLRKDAGFDIADRIHARFQAAGAWTRVVDQYRDTICAETLALDFTPELQGMGYPWEGDIDGERISLELARA
ncbi:MAG TPA: isoleucine--tRNA ligase [Chloroflexota bacterium]|nr:isoleucine--tRNA ligase [Chloroflexota bacterium]